MDKTLEIQKSVRDNCEDVKNSLLELSKWEKEIKLKEKEQKMNEEKIQQPPPLRKKPITTDTDNKNKIETADQLKATANELKEKYNNIKNICPQAIANIEKDKGNECVKCQDYEQGIIFYTKAINIFKESAFFSNRAFCFLKLKRYKECIEDCNTSIELDEQFIKSYFRRMKANELLGNIESAIKDCAKMMMLDPNNASFKKNFNDLMKLKSSNSDSTKMNVEKQDKEKNLSSTKDWSKTQEVEGKIDFVEKSPAQRSKKPLVRINIKEIDEIEKDKKQLDIFNIRNEKDDDSDSIPDEIVDQLFNNATGESTKKSPMYGQNYNNNRNYLTKTIDQYTSQKQQQSPTIISSQFELFKPPPPKSQSNPTIITYLTNDDNDTKKENTIFDINKIKDEDVKNDINNIRESIIPSDEPISELPKTGIQFQTTWKELTIAKKYTYLKAINELKMEQLNKIFASSLEMSLVSEIFTICNECFIKHNWPVLNIMKSIAKHDEIAIFSLMLSANDKIALNNILDYMKLNNVSNDDLTFIKKKFEL